MWAVMLLRRGDFAMRLEKLGDEVVGIATPREMRAIILVVARGEVATLLSQTKRWMEEEIYNARMAELEEAVGRELY
jgi:hypothetical protein